MACRLQPLQRPRTFWAQLPPSRPTISVQADLRGRRSRSGGGGNSHSRTRRHTVDNFPRRRAPRETTAQSRARSQHGAWNQPARAESTPGSPVSWPLLGLCGAKQPQEEFSSGAIRQSLIDLRWRAHKKYDGTEPGARARAGAKSASRSSTGCQCPCLSARGQSPCLRARARA